MLATEISEEVWTILTTCLPNHVRLQENLMVHYNYSISVPDMVTIIYNSLYNNGFYVEVGKLRLK